MHTFMLSEPKAVLVYFPDPEDIQEISKIRKLDNRLPIALVLNNSEDEVGETLKDKSTRILGQDEVSDYLDKL